MNTPDWAFNIVCEVCEDHARALPGEINWRQLKDSRQPSRAFEHEGELIVPVKKARTTSSGRTYYAKTKNGRQRVERKKTKNGYRFIKFNGKITVIAGTDEQDAKMVLLHELAHWVVGRNKPQGHTAAFWNKAFELYAKYGLNLDQCHEREKGYRQGASLAYARRAK